MARQERVRRDRKVTYTQEELDRAGREMAETEADRANAVDEEFERIKEEDRAAFQETLNRRYEENAERQWYVSNCIPEEKMTVSLYNARNHPGPRQCYIDFVDFNQ